MDYFLIVLFAVLVYGIYTLHKEIIELRRALAHTHKVLLEEIQGRR